MRYYLSFFKMRTTLKTLIFALIFALPFGTKKFIAVLLPQFFENAREFSSLFVYATDMLALTLIIYSFFYFKKEFFRRVSGMKWFVAFFVLAVISLFFATQERYALYMVAELVIAILAGLAIRNALAKDIVSFHSICAVLGLSAFIQAVIAILQFYYQKSIELWFLGEPVADATMKGVARVTIDGVSYLRSFGTLPHANILAAFLVLGFITLAYAYFTSAREQKFSRVASVVGMVTILFALGFTFSRSGWLIVGFSILAILTYGFTKHEFRRIALGFLGVILISGALLAYYFGWAIAPRAGFVKGEASVDHRVFYNEIGIALIKSHPFGVGIGNQVIVADQNGLYAEKGLTQIWLAQPVHNIYILIASELGILGIIVFLILLFYAFRAVRLKYPKLVFAGIMFGSLLAFGLVDHFPWDLHAGRLMFWVMFGIMLGLSAEHSRPSSFNG